MDFGDGEMGDIPTRPMRVKILYSFDQDNKTNCLARFPDVLQIPAVAIDENSQVGVIELNQCLQAIVAASPELISRLSDGDFTIYAYDYSEYDTPLVGQGMLSAALNVATPNQQNKTMITGRVCKNMMALFNNGVKETLEVKLRLVPVPKPSHANLARLDSYRSMSPAVSGGFDPNAWNASMQQTKSQQQMKDYFNFDTMSSGGDGGMALVDDMFGVGSTSSGSGSGQQMAGGVGVGETPTDAFPGFNPAFSAHSHSAPGSRAGSPMMSSESSIRNETLRHQSFSGNAPSYQADQSRPDSRASVRSEGQQSTHQRQASTPSIPQQQIQQQTEVYYNEDGQARKRAKVTQADWRGRSSFGSKSSDLRVTAATTASMHMHRPIAKRPVAPGSNLEPPPRVPTPVPQMNPMLQQQQQAHQANPRRSLLRQMSAADSDFMSDMETFSDAIVSSPDDDSPGNSVTAEGTPQEIPSSPPVFPGINQPQPSSPGLPTLPPPRMADSGYMSERGFTSSNIVDSFEDDEDRTPDAQDYEMASQYRSRGKPSQPDVKNERQAHGGPPTYPDDAPFNMERPGDMTQLPHKMLLDLPPPARREGSQGPRPALAPRATTTDVSAFHQISAMTPSEPPDSRRGSLALPPRSLLPAGELSGPDAAPQRPAPKKRQTMKRSRTATNDSEAGSPAPSDNEGNGPRSGSGAHRRKVIEERLQKSIAKGEMPTYCTHCGAIETPTWRRVYVKEFDVKPSPLDYAEGEGETIGVEITKTNQYGEATKFVVRKTMKKTKDMQPGPGFKDSMVCNPCGLWFNKFRVMRPSDKWGKRSGTRNRQKQKAAEEAGMSTDAIEPQSDVFYTDQVGPDDAGEDTNTTTSAYGEGQPDNDAADEAGRTNSRRPRASSLQAQQRTRGNAKGEWNASQLDAALTRAVQSSPVRFQGSQESPIEIEDLTPRPTRRLLFPSPRKDGEVKSLDDNGQVSLKSMPPSLPPGGLKPGIELSFEQSDTNVFEAFTFDKENMAPPLNGADDDDHFAGLFDGSPTALFKTPRKTPTAKNTATPRSLRQLNHLLQTPTPSHSRKRKPLTPNANAANNADLSNVNDFMTSPSSSRYFLRSTPSRQERTAHTPGRRSNSDNHADEVSPWSRHLAQMLSDANDGSNNKQFTSPSRGAFDFSDLPNFNTTPGGRLAQYDWEGLDGLLSSEFVVEHQVDDGGNGV
ncbi:hypothetical protein LTR37_009293 [Vermiconidia calcicola]|uniref:Uncharacterized protein n=1 Tax=Vermiconidia calcicola TaxID=1690605 RepID=A0ACC3N8G3_9PEZI|nr:hypothetical protein LTR37_009293 [Vermiconidia calcicola]